VKRVLGTVLFGVGVALAVFAAGLRFYVTPIATNIPYDLAPSTTIAEANNATYLSAATGGTETGTLRSTTDVVPQPVLTRDELEGDLDGSAVIWDVYSQITDTSSGSVVTASSQEIALDRKTGAYADWDGAWADSGDGQQSASFTGHSYKLPFNAERKAYPFWDDQLGEALDIEFIAVEEVSGLQVYKYEQTIAETTIEYGSLELLREAFGHGSGDVYYSNTRTIWVEPVTGQFLDVQEQPKLEFRAGDVSKILLQGNFRYTEQTKAEAANTVSDNRDQILLVSQTLPLAAGGAGVLLLIIGIILIATGRPEESDEASDERTEAYAAY
jgi:Porin PorA